MHREFAKIYRKPRKGKPWGIVYLLKANGKNIIKYGASNSLDVTKRKTWARRKWVEYQGENLKFEPIFVIAVKDPFGAECEFKHCLNGYFKIDCEYIVIDHEFFVVEKTEDIPKFLSALAGITYGRMD